MGMYLSDYMLDKTVFKLLKEGVGFFAPVLLYIFHNPITNRGLFILNNARILKIPEKKYFMALQSVT